MKHLIALALAALLTWVFLLVLGPVSGAIVRGWASLDAGQQAVFKVVVPLLAGVPALVILFRRHRARNGK